MWFLWGGGCSIVFGAWILTNRSRRTYVVLGWRKMYRWLVEGRSPVKKVATFPVYGSDDEEEGGLIKED